MNATTERATLRDYLDWGNAGFPADRQPPGAPPAEWTRFHDQFSQQWSRPICRVAFLHWQKQVGHHFLFFLFGKRVADAVALTIARYEGGEHAGA